MVQFQENKRLVFLDVIRSISILMIIFFHYNCATVRMVSENIYLTGYYKLAGSVGVSLFFILSGASLGLSNSENFTLKTFFKKRFLAIFPLFWTVYVLFFIVVMIIVRPSPFEGLNPMLFLFTILGIDGFLLYKIPNFYLIGEWFLGCLLILYLLFPVLRYLFFKNRHLLLIICCFISIFLPQIYSLDMPILRFPFFRIFEFVFGMYFIKAYKPDSFKDNLIFMLGSLAGIILMLFLSSQKGVFFLNILPGVLIFIFLSTGSNMVSGYVQGRIIEFISKYSFAAFLVHHLILVKAVGALSSLVKVQVYNYALFVGTALFIYFFAFIVQNALDFVLKRSGIWAG